MGHVYSYYVGFEFLNNVHEQGVKVTSAFKNREAQTAGVDFLFLVKTDDKLNL